jgi:hypothetical protein
MTKEKILKTVRDNQPISKAVLVIMCCRIEGISIYDNYKMEQMRDRIESLINNKLLKYERNKISIP